ncbi:MAG: transcription termination factor Rho [Verrucomicrobiota bacterium]|nr:transcription termination factor Rho [Verrucomicrobiota bacterium]
METNPPLTQNSIIVRGLYEPLPNKAGSLLDPARNGKSRPTDPFITREQVQQYKLKRGSTIVGRALQDPRFPNAKVSHIDTIDGMAPDVRRRQLEFSQLTTITPDEWLKLEKKDGTMTTRIMDIFCPIGKGQRGLIVAPPRTGKTTLLRDIALGVLENHPECHVMMLLVDERPEEVTDLRRSVPCEVFASSNDEDPRNHLNIAEFTIEHAKCLVEAGRDVVVLLDSITRLARAYNSAKGGSGRTMTGGLDIRALEKPRQLFSTARNTEEAGSLTIIASALIDTGSRMDELIFQEFKGTGNMEMVLDRKLAELRIWPAINIGASGTRREEMILKREILEKCSFFRRALATLKPDDAAETAITRLGKTRTNAEFFDLIDI